MLNNNKHLRPTAIIVVTVDCLRADHLGCYGYPIPTTPFLDRLAHKSTLFEYAFSSISYTTPSHASLLTGKYPRFHSVGFSNGGKALNREQEVTLPLILQGLGYKTAAFVSILALHKQFGLDLGFDTYDDTLPQWEMNRPEVLRRNANLTTAAVLNWIGENKANPFFIWIHYVEPHGPYTPPPPYDSLFVGKPSYGPPLRLEMVPLNTQGGIPDYAVLKPIHDSNGRLLDYERDATYYKSQYDGYVRLVDDHLKILLEKLSQWGLYDSSLLVITADHGEAMGENNIFFIHAPTVSLDQIHVPLIIKMPSQFKFKPRKLMMPVSTIDIMPTILAFCGCDAGYLGLQGMNLLPLLSGNNIFWTERLIFSETPAQISIIDSRFQLLYGKAREEALRHSFPYVSAVEGIKLFDYNSDPLGIKDLSAEHPDIMKRLKIVAERYFRIPQPVYLPISAELKEHEKESLKQRLKLLGYG